jgi:Ubiquitin-2 like Rad60 SUMO-like
MIYHKLVAMLDSPVEKQQRLADACSVYHTAFSAPAMWSSSSASVTGAALSRKRKFDASSADSSSSSSDVHAVPAAKRQAVPNTTSSTAEAGGFGSRVMRATRSLFWAVLPARGTVTAAPAASVSVADSSTQTCEEDFSVDSSGSQPVLTQSSAAAVPAATVTPVKDAAAAAAAVAASSSTVASVVAAAAAVATAAAATAAATDQAVSFTDASVPAADKVHIVVTGYAYDRTLHYSLKRTARLERLFLDYSVKAQKEIDTLRFLLDDRRLSPDDTADALGLENGDEVCVFLEQVGC